MKQIIFLYLLFGIKAILYGQLSDDFSDMDFTNNPEWFGETEKFIVNENQELQLYDIDFNNPAWISLPCDIAENAFWSFDVRMDFNPSSSNYMDVFLISNQENPLEASTAYFLRIGDANDRISLYKTANGNSTSLIIGPDDATDTSSLALHIELSYQNQEWQLIYQNENQASETLFASDTIDSGNQYFSVLCHYTTSRKDKFFIDNINISGEPYQDLHKPELTQFHISSPSSLYIEFSEALKETTVLQKENYLHNNDIHPSAISPVIQKENAYILQFEYDFPYNAKQFLHIANIQDLAGNYILPVDTSFNNAFYFPHDIVFTELMADPSPPVLLAEAEYLEIYNRVDYPVQLKDFQLEINEQTKQLPDTILPARSYAVLCHPNELLLFPEDILCIAIEGFSIKNDGAAISLKNKESLLIDDFYYTTDSYSEANKKNGGWSLEKIDPNVFCADLENWDASNDEKGGTPGKTNSINANRADTLKPYLTSVSFASEHELLLSFNERLKNTLRADHFKVNFQVAHHIEILEQNNMLVSFENAFLPKTLYQLSISSPLEDCNGNKKLRPIQLFIFPETLEKEDLIINEILFNPYPGGLDFIEIYNRSSKVIDLQGLRLARYENGIIDQIAVVSEESHLLYPENYRILCTDSSGVTPFYNCNKNAFIEMSAFPSLPDDRGGLALCFPWLEIIDQLSYDEDMHFSHLNKPEGVSLERVYEELPAGSSNWHSASFLSNFASPGHVNSQHKPAAENQNAIDIFPKIISPNNDGHQDFLSIRYTLDQNDLTGNVLVYNRYGQLVRQISNHTSIGSQGLFRWDGTNENGQTVSSGIYIIVFEYFNEKSQQFRETKSCIVRKQ